MNRLWLLIALLMVFQGTSFGEGQRTEKGRKNCGTEQCKEGRKHHSGGREKGSQPMMFAALGRPETAEKLGLTEEQRSAIQERLKQSEQLHRKIKEKTQKAAMKQARLLTAKEPDEKELMAVVEELGSYRTEMAKDRIRLILFMRRTLTEEQMGAVRRLMRSRMNDFRRRQHEMRQEKSGNRRGGRGDRSEGRLGWQNSAGGRRPMPHQSFAVQQNGGGPRNRTLDEDAGSSAPEALQQGQNADNDEAGSRQH